MSRLFRLNAHSVQYTENQVFSSRNRSYILIYAESGTSTIQLKSGSTITLYEGSKYEPIIVPTGDITVTTTGSYVVLGTERVATMQGRYYLRPDGVSTYIEFQSAIAPKLGDTLEFKFIAPLGVVSSSDPLLSGVSNGIHLNFDASGYINYNSARVDAYLDGEYIIDDSTSYPIDGEVHTITVIGKGTGTIDRALANNKLVTFSEVTIFDLSITLAATGEFFLPIDDGYSVDGTLVETLQGWNANVYNDVLGDWEFSSE